MLKKGAGGGSLAACPARGLNRPKFTTVCCWCRVHFCRSRCVRSCRSCACIFTCHAASAAFVFTRHAAFVVNYTSRRVCFCTSRHAAIVFHLNCIQQAKSRKLTRDRRGPKVIQRSAASGRTSRGSSWISTATRLTWDVKTSQKQKHLRKKSITLQHLCDASVARKGAKKGKKSKTFGREVVIKR